MNKLYDLDDVHLIPRVASTLQSREEAKPTVELFPDVTLTVPIIASPMMDVCNGSFALKMRELGGFGFIHRFSSIGDQVKEFYDSDKQGGCAIGLGAEGVERFEALRAAGCKYFCLDVANGFSEEVRKALEFYSHTDTYFIVGNVASKEGYQYLSSLSNVFGIRCGIAGGGACTTKNATGIYYPIGSLLEEIRCSRMKRQIDENGHIWYQSLEYQEKPLAIADGGINTPDRMCKTLALGADAIMMGSALAVAQESPAKKVNGFTHRNGKRPYDPMGHVMTWGKMVIDSTIFRGSASFEVQKEYREPRYIEGQEILLPYKGESLSDIITKFMSGLRSSMSYFNARTLEEFRTNVSYGIKQ